LVCSIVAQQVEPFCHLFGDFLVGSCQCVFFPGRFKGENFENPAMFEDMFIQFSIQPEKNGRSASRVLTQGLSPDIIGEIADVLESPWFLADFLRDILLDSTFKHQWCHDMISRFRIVGSNSLEKKKEPS